MALKYFIYSEMKGLCEHQALFTIMVLAKTQPPAQYHLRFCCRHLLSTRPAACTGGSSTALFPLQTGLTSHAGFPLYFLSDSAGVTSANFSLSFLPCFLLTLLSQIPEAPPQLQFARAPVKLDTLVASSLCLQTCSQTPPQLLC